MRRILILLSLVASGANAQVYKCVTDGKTVYQEEPCERWEDRRIIRDRMTIVESFDRRPVQRAEPQRARVGGGAIGGGSADGEHPSCPHLRQRIEWIDARARQRSTQGLKDERHRVKADLSRLGCREMD